MVSNTWKMKNISVFPVTTIAAANVPSLGICTKRPIKTFDNHVKVTAWTADHDVIPYDNADILL